MDAIIIEGKDHKPKDKPKNRTLLRVLPEYTGTDGFPYFSDGDVFIILDPKIPEYQYRLHSVTLERFSSEFQRTLKLQMNELIPKKLAQKIGIDPAFRYEYVASQRSGWNLLRKVGLIKVF